MAPVNGDLVRKGEEILMTISRTVYCSYLLIYFRKNQDADQSYTFF